MDREQYTLFPGNRFIYTLTMLLLLLSALSLGFVGSFHCVGMCGPIALTLPVQHLSGYKKMAGILLYNLGRMSAYALLGLLFGWLGRQFYLGGLQQWLSIALGYLLLVIAGLQYITKRRSAFFSDLGVLTKGLQKVLGNLLRRQQFRTLYAIGFFNGLLPCGLVYLGITGAIATAHVYQGALFMAVFGAGPLPAMTAVAWCSHLLSLRVRNRVRQMIPLVMVIMAGLLIVRGLNLGIPYLSPAMHAHTHNIIECHKP